MKTIDLDFNFGVYRFTQKRNRNHQKPDERHGAVGHGWNTTRLVTHLVKSGNDYTLYHSTGGSMRFTFDPADGSYVFKKDPQNRLFVEDSRYRIVRSDESVWLFNKGTGLLERIDCTNGGGVLFEYDSSNRPTSVKALLSVQENRFYGTLAFAYMTRLHRWFRRIITPFNQTSCMFMMPMATEYWKILKIPSTTS